MLWTDTSLEFPQMISCIFLGPGLGLWLVAHHHPQKEIPRKTHPVGHPTSKISLYLVQIVPSTYNTKVYLVGKSGWRFCLGGSSFFGNYLGWVEWPFGWSFQRLGRWNHRFHNWDSGVFVLACHVVRALEYLIGHMALYTSWDLSLPCTCKNGTHTIQLII